MSKQNILTPGAKNRFLDKLQFVKGLVETNSDREAIMWYTAELMPMIVGELNYYNGEPETPTRKRKRS